MPSQQEVEHAVAKYLVDKNVEPRGESWRTTRFDELGFDEFDIDLLVMYLEDAFAARLDFIEAGHMTLGDLVNMVMTAVHNHGIQWSSMVSRRNEEEIRNEKYF